MRKRHGILILMLIMIVLISGCKQKTPERNSFRPHREHPHPERPTDVSKFEHCRIERMADDLDLTREQVDTLKKIEFEIMKKRFELMKNRKHRKDIKENIVMMIRKDSLTDEEILEFMNELHLQHEKLRREIDSFTARGLARMHSILTEEQREKLAKKLEKFRPPRRFEPRKEIR